MNAAFFDIDGTLFDTRADLAATVNHTRRDLGLAEWPEEAILANVGQGAKYLLEHSIPEGEDLPIRRFVGCSNEGGGSANDGPRSGSSNLSDIFFSHYAEHCTERVTPYPGARETLEELQRRSWLLGVNTNKPNFAVRRILEKFGFTRYFGNAVVAGGDGIALKPDAASLRECAARLRGHRLSARDWMVGDSWTDMQCASNAGVKGAFCTFGFGKLKDARYTMRINRLEELLRHLKDED